MRLGMVPGFHDWRSVAMVTLSALVSGLDAELVRLGYKGSTMVWYRGCWRRLEKFFAARGVEEFSRDLALAWVDEACGFFDKEQAGAPRNSGHPRDLLGVQSLHALPANSPHLSNFRWPARVVSAIRSPSRQGQYSSVSRSRHLDVLITEVRAPDIVDVAATFVADRGQQQGR
jgi:hypothetical protein